MNNENTDNRWEEIVYAEGERVFPQGFAGKSGGQLVLSAFRSEYRAYMKSGVRGCLAASMFLFGYWSALLSLIAAFPSGITSAVPWVNDSVGVAVLLLVLCVPAVVFAWFGVLIARFSARQHATRMMPYVALLMILHMKGVLERTRPLTIEEQIALREQNAYEAGRSDGYRSGQMQWM